MPTYELCLLLRIMPRTELVQAIKRTAESIYDKGGLIRKLDNLGTRETPHKMTEHSQVHKRATYFLFRFDAPTAALAVIHEECGRDVDIIRRRIIKTEPIKMYPCLLDEELQPPAYRKEVKQMIEMSKRKEQKNVYEFKMGIDYYPFQR